MQVLNSYSDTYPVNSPIIMKISKNIFRYTQSTCQIIYRVLFGHLSHWNIQVLFPTAPVHQLLFSKHLNVTIF